MPADRSEPVAPIGPPGRWAPWSVWAIAALVFLVLVAVSFERTMGLDEGIWNHVARTWVDDGVPPYQGPVENKTPGIFYVFALSYLLAGTGCALPRLLGIVAMVATSVVVCRLGRRFRDDTAGLAAMLVFGLAQGARAVDGPETSMTGSFMVLFTTLAVHDVVGAGAMSGASRAGRLARAGAWLGTAIAFKQIAVVTAPALALLAWSFTTPVARRSLGGWLRDLVTIGAGVLAATMASLVPLWLAGVSLREYWQGAWLILMDRGSGLYPLGARLLRLRRGMIHPLPALLLGLAAFAALRRPLIARGVPWGPLLAWFALDAAGVAASGYFFPHHFKQIVPQCALAAGVLASLLVETLARTVGRARLVRVVVLVAIALAIVPQQPLLDRLMLVPPSPRRYAPHDRLGQLAHDRTAPGDYVFTWVWGGLVQGLSRRPSPSRYFNRNFATSRAAIQQIQRDLARRPPRLVVVEGKPPPWLEAYLEGYRVESIADRRRFAVYERGPSADGGRR